MAHLIDSATAEEIVNEISRIESDLLVMPGFDANSDQAASLMALIGQVRWRVERIKTRPSPDMVDTLLNVALSAQDAPELENSQAEMVALLYKQRKAIKQHIARLRLQKLARFTEGSIEFAMILLEIAVKQEQVALLSALITGREVPQS